MYAGKIEEFLRISCLPPPVFERFRAHCPHEAQQMGHMIITSCKCQPDIRSRVHRVLLQPESGLEETKAARMSRRGRESKQAIQRYVTRAFAQLPCMSQPQP